MKTCWVTSALGRKSKVHKQLIKKGSAPHNIKVNRQGARKEETNIKKQKQKSTRSDVLQNVFFVELRKYKTKFEVDKKKRKINDKL